MQISVLIRSCRISIALLFYVLQAFIFYGQGISIAQENDSIRIECLRQDMDSIASDATEGRFTASPGYKKAADYAVSIFRKAGLKPGWINEKGEKSYFQPVPFIRNNYAGTSISIRKGGTDKTFAHSAGNFVILSLAIHGKEIAVAPPVFVGYGISEPAYGWDDYKGMDVKSRWVILLNGLPSAAAGDPAFPESLYGQYGNWRTRDSLKLNALITHKAAGVIVLSDKYATENWEYAVLQNYRFNYMHYAGVNAERKNTSDLSLPFILIHQDLAKYFLADKVYDPMTKKGYYHSYVLSNTRHRSYSRL